MMIIMMMMMLLLMMLMMMMMIMMMMMMLMFITKRPRFFAREISPSLYAGMHLGPGKHHQQERGGLGRQHAQRYLAVHSLGCSRRPLRPVGPAGTSSLSSVANDVQASPGGDLHSPSQAEHMSGHGLAERNVRTRRPAAVSASTAPLQSGVSAARAAGAPSRSAAAAHALPPETRTLDVT